MSAAAYAVVRGSLIYIDTVSSTPRAAMVNWLAVHEHVTILSSATDAMIRDEFIARAAIAQCRLAEVTVAITRLT